MGFARNFHIGVGQVKTPSVAHCGPRRANCPVPAHFGIFFLIAFAILPRSGMHSQLLFLFPNRLSDAGGGRELVDGAPLHGA